MTESNVGFLSTNQHQSAPPHPQQFPPAFSSTSGVSHLFGNPTNRPKSSYLGWKNPLGINSLEVGPPVNLTVFQPWASFKAQTLSTIRVLLPCFCSISCKQLGSFIPLWTKSCAGNSPTPKHWVAFTLQTHKNFKFTFLKH